jgi:hypothetical protein
MVSPVVATMVVGATTIEELRSDLGALSVQLDAGRERRLPLDQAHPDAIIRLAMIRT